MTDLITNLDKRIARAEQMLDGTDTVKDPLTVRMLQRSIKELKAERERERAQSSVRELVH